MTAGNDGKPQTQPGLLQILEQLAPEDLHRDVWAACMAPRWFFGNRSTDAQSSRPFWKMDLEGVDAVDRLWRHAQLECERLAGALRATRHRDHLDRRIVTTWIGAS